MLNRLYKLIIISGLFALTLTACSKPTPHQDMNQLTYSLDGAAPVSVQGPVLKFPIAAEPKQFAAGVFPAAAPRINRVPGMSLSMFVPNEGPNSVGLVLAFGLNSSTGGSYNFTQGQDWAYFGEVGNRHFNFYLSNNRTNLGDRNLTLTFDSETNYYHGEFDMSYCSMPGFYAGTCDIAANIHRVKGSFDIKRDDSLFEVPFEGSAESPVALGNAPVLTGRSWNTDREAGYYSVNVFAGKRYIALVESDRAYARAESAPFEIYDGANLVTRLCTSQFHSAYGDRCEFTASQPQVLMRVKSPVVDRHRYVQLLVVEDMSDYPAVVTKKLNSFTSHVQGKVHAWNEVYRIPVSANEVYSLRRTNENSKGFYGVGISIYNGDVTIATGVQNDTCLESSGLPCKVYASGPIEGGMPICSYVYSREGCVFRTTSAFVTVVVSASDISGGGEYSFDIAKSSATHQNQGSSSTPVPVDATTGIKFAGDVEFESSYYRATVTPGKYYAMYIDSARKEFSASSLYILVEPATGVRSFSCSYTSRCIVYASGSTIDIKVSRYNSQSTPGENFELSITPVEFKYQSQTKTLGNEPLGSYQGQGEFNILEGSQYSFNTVPNAKYTIELELVNDIPVNSINFDIVKVGTFDYSPICSSTFVSPTKKRCVFQAASESQTVQLRVGAEPLVFVYDYSGGTTNAAPPLGSAFNFTLSSDPSAVVFTNEGTSISPIRLSVDQAYHGQVNTRESYYAVAVEPHQTYSVRVVPDKHETTWSFDNWSMSQSNGCWSPIYMPVFDLGECIIYTSETQADLTITTRAIGAQGSTYTITVNKLPN